MSVMMKLQKCLGYKSDENFDRYTYSYLGSP